MGSQPSPLLWAGGTGSGSAVGSGVLVRALVGVKLGSGVLLAAGEGVSLGAGGAVGELSLPAGAWVGGCGDGDAVDVGMGVAEAVGVGGGVQIGLGVGSQRGPGVGVLPLGSGGAST